MRKSISGTLKPLITMRDIAKQANVSQTMVSFVLNNRADLSIAPATRERVITTARALGYRPNQMARALAMGRTNTIGLWIRSLHSSFYTQLVHDIDQVVTKGSYALIVSRNARISEVSSIMQEFPMMSVDGIIAVDIPDTVVHFSGAASPTTPLVSVGTEGTDVVDSVSVELATGVREALTHLYASGRRTIALLIDEPAHGVGGGERMATYLAFMDEAGLPPDMILSKGQSHREALDAVQERLLAGPVPDALLCYNDDMAMGAIRAIKDRKLTVPGDIAVIGCDNVAEGPYLDPPLSTIAFPNREACCLAWEFLTARIGDPDAPLKQVRLIARFIARGSS